MAVCVFKAATNFLLTKERMQQKGVLVDLNCSLCNSTTESNEHLFFECNYTAYVWKWCRIKLGFPSNNTLHILEELNVISSRFKAKDKFRDLVRISFATCVWCIWKQRNERVFRNQNMDRRKLCDNIVNLTCIRLSKSNKVMPNDTNQKKIIEDWIIPS